MTMLDIFKNQCEAEIAAIAKFRPVLCPIFEVMGEQVEQCYQSMKVSDFVDMCLSIADQRERA